MSFIAKNPLILPKIESDPSAPPSGTRGIYAKDDGWYDINDNGETQKLGYNNGDSEGQDIGVEEVYVGVEEPTDENIKLWINPDEENDEFNGKSAYEIALDNGFEGTEEEWLESLKGQDGQDGYTPQKGVDYWTDTDKDEIIQSVIENLGGNPIFGYVDENNNIIVQGNLAGDTYNVKYEMEDGTLIDIGELVLEENDEPTPTYTNLLPLSVDTDGNEFVGTHENGGDGYEYGYRISKSSGAQTAQDGVYCSGFIPATLNDTIRIKGITSASTDTHNVIAFYDSSKTYITGLYNIEGNAHLTIDGDFYTINPNASISNSFAFFRFSCGSITDETIVTVNEEIV